MPRGFGRVVLGKHVHHAHQCATVSVGRCVTQQRFCGDGGVVVVVMGCVRRVLFALQYWLLVFVGGGVVAISHRTAYW